MPRTSVREIHMAIMQMVNSLTFKILIGAVLAAAMIISLLYLTQDLHLYLGKLESGDLLQLGSFSVLLATAGTGLFFLLKNKEVKTDSPRTGVSITELLSFDYKVLGIKFVEGFIIGLTKEIQKDK